MQNPNFEQLSLNGTVTILSAGLIILAQQWKIDCVLRHKIAHKVSSAKQRLQWSFLPIYVKETASQSLEYT